MAIFRILFFALLPTMACETKDPKTYERVEHYETGQVSRRFNIVNGKIEGKMTDYYNDGKLMAERYFVNGAQEGRTVIYYPSGQIKEVQYFELGKKQGGDTLWYEDGNIQFVTTLKNDKKDGYLRKWNPSGDLIFEAKYSLDTLIEVKGQKISPDNLSAKPSQIIKKKD
ncbi:MAG: toxin-antitoxin system YwqK family antitoxin [Saprospiraceae bacterium]